MEQKKPLVSVCDGTQSRATISFTSNKKPAANQREQYHSYYRMQNELFTDQFAHIKNYVVEFLNLHRSSSLHPLEVCITTAAGF